MTTSMSRSFLRPDSKLGKIYDSNLSRKASKSVILTAKTPTGGMSTIDSSPNKSVNRPSPLSDKKVRPKSGVAGRSNVAAKILATAGKKQAPKGRPVTVTGQKKGTV